MELQSKIRDLSNNVESFCKEVENKIIVLEENKSDSSSSTKLETMNTQHSTKNFKNKLQSSKNTSKIKKIFIIIEVLIGYIVLSFVNIGLGLFYLIIIYLLYIIYKIYKKKIKKK